MIKNIVDTGAEVFFRVGRSNISGSGSATQGAEQGVDLVVVTGQ